ncbi:MAG: metal-dependent hydrolase, partial [Terriglobales bacterium]
PLAAPVAALPGQPAVKNIRLEDLWPEAAVSSAAAAPELAPPPAAPLPSWGLCLLLGFTGVGSHLLLDLTTSYGMRLLWPFSQHWFAWDLMPPVDPWVWIILLFLLLAPMTLGLVGSEIGARRRPHRLSAIIALAAVTVWIGVRAFYHSRVTHMLAATAISGQMPSRVGAFPYSGSPGLWHTVAEVKGKYQLGVVDATPAQLLPPELSAVPPQTLYTPVVTPQIALAKSTPAAQSFLSFARFPFIYTQRQDDGGTDVLITDLRFKTAHQPPDMGLLIREGPNLRVQSTQLYWQGAAAALGPQP